MRVFPVNPEDGGGVNYLHSRRLGQLGQTCPDEGNQTTDGLIITQVESPASSTKQRLKGVPTQTSSLPSTETPRGTLIWLSAVKSSGAGCRNVKFHLEFSHHGTTPSLSSR
jgi:hypothetical protein